MYLTDPKSDKKSVSLTFLVISFFLFAGISVGSAFDLVNDVDALSELFYACAALYFGRRVQVNTKNFNVDQETK